MFREGHIYIQPRRTGKTTSLLEMKGINDILITNVKNFPQHLTKGRGYINIITPLEFIDIVDKLKGINKPFSLLIDEWFHYSDVIKDKIYAILNSNNYVFSDVIIKSTADRLYNFNVVDMLRMLRSIKDLKTVEGVYNNSYIKNFKHELNSIISDPRFVIHEWNEVYKRQLSIEDYTIEILGELFKRL